MLQSKKLVKINTVKHQEFLWKTRDNKKLFAQCWNAGPDMHAGILLVHGLGEHSSRYDRWARWLAEEGFSVLSFDIRGHGKTPGKVASPTNYNKLLGDIDQLIEHAIKLFPDKPLFLYGHGFGGNLVSNFAISQQLNISGIILSSPWFMITRSPSRLKLLASTILSRFVPGIRIKTGLRPEDISRELREVHLYRNDPFIHNLISLRLFTAACKHGLIAKRSIYKVNLPLLVMHGSADAITSCKASREFVMNSGKKTSYIEIEGGFHELHNDSDFEKVFRTIINWLQDQIKH